MSESLDRGLYVLESDGSNIEILIEQEDEYVLSSDGAAVDVYEVRETDEVVEILVLGPQGPPGPAGAGGNAFDFTQGSAAATWTIPHNLGHYPVIDVRDAGGNVLLVQVQHLSLNTAQVSFITTVAGTARCV